MHNDWHWGKTELGAQIHCCGVTPDFYVFAAIVIN
jgi:hypothetical protein